jgi:nucleoside phosphorylase
MNNIEKDLLLAQISDQFKSLIEHKFYYPSRVAYLNAIIRNIDTLDRKKKYCILALNSSVASQRLLGSGGYDFRPYLGAFRERASLGDFIFRVYCLSKTSKGRLGQQLTEIRAVISENMLDKCVNLYKIGPETFNCAYFFPISSTADVELLSKVYQSAHSGDNSAIKHFLSELEKSIDYSASILYHEHHDYDSQNTAGCGFRFAPLEDSDECRDKLSLYSRVANDSFHIDPKISNQDHRAADHRIGIIVALPIEFEAVKAQLDKDSVKLMDASTGVAFFHATTTKNGQTVDIIIVQLPGTGNIASTLGTALLLERYAVSDIFHVGIAGGLKGEVQLGDVVVANTVVYAEKKKIHLNDEKPDYRIQEARFSELSTIHNPNRYQGRMNVPMPLSENASLRMAHFGCAILCVEKVITDPSWLSKVREQINRKLLGVENEAYGIYFSANQIDPSKTQFITVKGISDFADSEKSDDWHEYAADASAAYVLDVIHRLHFRA